MLRYFSTKKFQLELLVWKYKKIEIRTRIYTTINSAPLNQRLVVIIKFRAYKTNYFRSEAPRVTLIIKTYDPCHLHISVSISYSMSLKIR